MNEATLKTSTQPIPALLNRSLREADVVGRRVCLSWGQALSQGFVLG